MTAHTAERTAIVTLGIDRLLTTERRLVEGRRVGLLCNPASIDGSFRHSADLLFDDPGMTLATIFGPQHGFRADLQDNMIETPHGSDARRQVPVFSLYSEVREPSAEMLDGLEALVIDIQDVGTRVYTFIYTVANCMKAAARQRIPVIVCDRPNPVNGRDVEGNLLDEAYASFVGQFPIPMRHGMTVGELARLFNDHFRIGADLHVVAMDGWTRGMYYDETTLPWVMPSPNIPTLDTAIVYPGAVLIEGTKLSEGRGTTRPFELIGAPWIDGERLADAMNATRPAGRPLPPGLFRADVSETRPADLRRLPDSRPRPAGVSTGPLDSGVDRRVPPAVAVAVRVARASLRVRARQDADRHPLRIGSPATGRRRRDVPALVDGWQADEDRFRRLRESSLLY